MKYTLTATYPNGIVAEKVVDSADKACCLITLTLMLNEGVNINVRCDVTKSAA